MPTDMMPDPTAAGPASIDSPAVRQAGRDVLSLALMDARNHTLQLLSAWESGLRAGQVLLPPLPRADAPRGDAAPPVLTFDPPVWLAGHIGWFAESWIGRNTQRGLGDLCPAEPMRLASIEPRADGWWSDALVPREARAQPGLPDGEATRAWLLETLESTLELLEKTPADDRALYFFRLALFHEDLRGEQLVVMAQALGLPLALALPGSMGAREPLLVPAGRWTLGPPSARGFAFDNECGQQEIEVPAYEIDAHPVTWAQYVEFVEDGGYDREDLWHPQGWAWLQALAASEGRRGPRHVEQIGGAGGAVLQIRFGRTTRMAGGQPAMHMSWWEADAWCRWAGRRLPTEVEWDQAAHTASRRGFHWGDAWEWTASTFRPWSGFEPGPWAAYSQPAFGRARVLRGGSFATRTRLKSPRFRGFALPGRDDLFTGFRSCAL
jgi:ergothioneine biosynthesis protein EgtB